MWGVKFNCLKWLDILRWHNWKTVSVGGVVYVLTIRFASLLIDRIHLYIV